jgi:hypothetical protein
MSKTNNSIDELVLKFWLDSKESVETKKGSKELECRFGYNDSFNRTHFEDVIKKLKSVGFSQQVEQQEESVFLRIVPSKVNNWGTREERIPMSCRMEIKGQNQITNYLNNEITVLELIEKYPESIHFEEKTLHKDSKGETIKPAMFPDFNFKMSYTEETPIPSETVLDHMAKSTMNFYRMIHRITFSRADFPFLVDFSVVESYQGLLNKKGKDEKWKKKYEIEIEVENSNPKLFETTNTQLAFLFRKMIKYILCGLQQTNFPIALSEQQQVLNEYQQVTTKNIFIGPNSKTMHLEHVERLPQFYVTEKADGERHLLFIASSGKIYLIKHKMQVVFTGCITKQSIYSYTILDGELILHNKEGQFINLFAVFDIYFMGQNTTTTSTKKHVKKDSVLDCRSVSFLKTGSKKVMDSRYKLLESLLKKWEPVSVVEDDTMTPMTFAIKKFYKSTPKLIKQVLKTAFPYQTDGLILTSSDGTVNDDCSLKWKPLEKTTIDFFVQEEKDVEWKLTFPTGIPTKRFTLKCGYTKAQLLLDPKRFVLNFINSGVGNFEEFEEGIHYINRPFIPTNPYDPTAYVCYLPVDSKGRCFTADTNELITDKSIVEFAYELARNQWIPLKLRTDKVNFGNNFNTANSNWTFLHCPVTEAMLTTTTATTTTTTDTAKPTALVVPNDISSDAYYLPVNKAVMKTAELKQFHNWIKRRLLEFVLGGEEKKTLIDLGCGKAGDLHKWMHNKLSFVLGVDNSLDNIVNPKDGCYSRFLEQCFKKNKESMKENQILFCLFVQGDCGKDLKSGEGIPLSEDFQLVEAIFGTEKEKEKEEKEIKEEKKKRPSYPVHGEFDVCSCQFALHYFFKSKDTLKAFLINVYNTTKVGGYFIGCCFDGKKILELSEDRLEINDEEGNRIFLLEKSTTSKKEFKNDSTCLGLKISVYQESINQLVDEYLVNFDYLTMLLETIGFFPIEETELFESKIHFSEIKAEQFTLSDAEKQISYLNRIFIFQKKSSVMKPDLLQMF